MRAHLADLAEFWASIGVSVEDQRRAASWAFPEPAAAAEPGRAELPENSGIAWNQIGCPTRPTPEPIRMSERFDHVRRQLAEYGMIAD